MDYLETQATLDTGHRTKRNKKFKHETENKKDDQYGPHQKTGGELCYVEIVFRDMHFACQSGHYFHNECSVIDILFRKVSIIYSE
jgi:hypothetical protein